MSGLRIAYLNNPDPVFFNELDKKLIDILQTNGGIVTPFELDDISMKIQTNKISFYLKDSKEEFEFDAFMFYGYMSAFKDVAFNYLLTAVEKAGKFCLHSVKNLNILNNKLLLSYSFSNARINIPSTFTAFSIPAIRDVIENHFGKDEISICKNFIDYGGDGVKKCNYCEAAVNSYARFFWNKEYTLLQKFIPDSVGKSIRVFIVGGKAVALAEYIDQTGDFRSNISFYREFKLVNLDSHPKKDQYIEAAEKASESVGDIVVCGVDIIDSQEKGILVLEINAFPDLYDISKSTGVDVFNLFSQYFIKKSIEHKK